MIDLARIMNWIGLRQSAFAERVGIDQGGISKILSGDAVLSARLRERILERVTPHVLFISYSGHSTSIVSAMLIAGQIDCSEHEPEAFNIALKQGLRIAVITNDKNPFLALIAHALTDSGLPNIPIRGIMIGKSGQAEPWDD